MHTGNMSVNKLCKFGSFRMELKLKDWIIVESLLKASYDDKKKHETKIRWHITFYLPFCSDQNYMQLKV